MMLSTKQNYMTRQSVSSLCSGEKQDKALGKAGKTRAPIRIKRRKLLTTDKDDNEAVATGRMQWNEEEEEFAEEEDGHFVEDSAFRNFLF